MTTSIKLTKDLAGHDKGDTIEVSDETAVRLIERGVAEDTDGTAKTTDEGDGHGDGDEQHAGKPAGKPAGNASLEDWTAYALANGHSEAELKGLKRDDVKALFEA